MGARFEIPGRVIIGGGSRREVAEHCRRLSAGRVLLVTDPGMRQLGVLGEIEAILSAADIDVSVFDGVQPDPTDANVLAGLTMLRKRECQLVVALGGGSSIDAAKAISMLAANPLPLGQYMGYHKVPSPGVPLVAIPTTAGTGSEVTKVTVITASAEGVKMMMLDPHFLPSVALVDYELTMSMPRGLTAAVGVDTLTHGIEAYVSRKASGMTDPLALSCIRLVSQHLRAAFNQPDNAAAREGMMLAACQGGMAFANSSVCLVHGMSRPIGALFHVPHGLSNAVLLPAVTQFSLPQAVSRYATVARTMGLTEATDDAEAADAIVDGLNQLNADLQIPRLRDCCGVAKDRFDAMVSKMATDALTSGSPQNNPRVPTHEEIVGLYQEAW